MKLVAAVVGVCLALTVMPSVAKAENQSEPSRVALYRVYHAKHPNLDAEIADLRAKTRVLVAHQPRRMDAISAPSKIWRVPGALQEVWDAAGLPEMMVIPAGEYTMGSPDSEPGRWYYEGPRHRVRIAHAFAVAEFELTKGEFARFVAATGYNAKMTCSIVDKRGKIEIGRYDWDNTGFPQTDQSPAVCINFDDAQAYVTWLAATTGKPYRLLSEAEWEWAARGGTTTARFWGPTAADQCSYANGVDRASVAAFPNWVKTDCDDHAPYTARVGSYAPNPFGLYDTIGNVWEWTQDCGNESYVGAPRDGSAWEEGDCSSGILRGGSWDDDQPSYLRSAERLISYAGERVNNSGLRLARDL